MEERKFIKLKKEEYAIKEYVKRFLGKGRISKLDIEYTPVGEKIIISTATPGLVIGRKGEKIEELTNVLKTRFKLENPHIEIKEIENPLFDSQIVADDIAMSLEKVGNIKFKVVAYKKLQEIMSKGALGCELRLSGKLPSERAKSWRFSEGYLKKSGDSTKEVDRAQSTALTKTGIIGVKVAIMRPDAKLYDRVYITEEVLSRIRIPASENKSNDLNKKNEEEAKKAEEEKDIKPKKPRKKKEGVKE
jgi:small subunit ribosomal protein S3